MPLLPAFHTIFSSAHRLTPAQQEKERSMFWAILLDISTWILIAIATIASGSLTTLAELPRGGLLLLIEIISVVTMRRAHRGEFSAFEYGIGKIERVISILIAAGLLIAAAFTLQATASRLSHPVILPTPAMMLGVVAASYNLMINFYCVGAFTRANQQESSLIIASQVRSRLVKTIASGIVVLVLVLATWLSDPKAATYVDALGALFVISYMAITSVNLLRESLPDLLDRALPEREQLLLLRVITRNFADFDRFGSIKSRSSGGRAYISVDLEFPRDMTLLEATERCAAIEREIVELIPDASISVVPHVSPAAPPEGPAAA